MNEPAVEVLVTKQLKRQLARRTAALMMAQEEHPHKHIGGNGRPLTVGCVCDDLRIAVDAAKVALAKAEAL